MIRKNLAFFIPFLIWIILGGFTLIQFDKPSIHLYLNQFHSPVADFFFFWITNLGDGIFAVCLIIVVLFFNYGNAFRITSAIIISTIVTQFLKRVIYHDALRPGSYFESLKDLTVRYVPDVYLYSLNSFPSGHANTSFCLFLSLVFFTDNHILKFLCFVIAFLGAYSRVYLSQHFFVDIYFGSIFGVLITMVVFAYLNEKRMGRISWAGKSLISRRDDE